MANYIVVTYELVASSWAIWEMLLKLNEVELLSFDVETRGLYTKEQRKEATKLLKSDMSIENHKLASVVANNSGLSFPAVTRTTHFIFGLSESHSVIMVTDTAQKEMMVWRWLRMFKGLLIIHNTLFDLKIMYHRVGALPQNYEDTQLMLKTLVNDADVWKAKVGLKDVMGSYYSPNWALYNQYEPDRNKDPKFLDYAATDGAATYLLYQNLISYAEKK
ncbi:MAG: hypothetical protein GY820_21135 [Gammaproteobacteria bacterium]|nr:hypothetical protein [Gammaproteobacteria bacterium]